MRVSVIIPCFNAGEFIGRCLASVQAQTYPDLEIICVDDGSSDDTAEKIKAIAGNSEKKIKLILRANAGASSARNTGLAAASGEYIQFLDADDTIGPGKIAAQVEEAVKNDYPDIIVSPYVRISAGGTQDINCEKDPWIGVMRSRLGCTCSNLWKKSAVLAAGKWNTQLKSSQEYDLIFRMLKNRGTVFHVMNNETEVHVREGSISTSNPGENWKRFLALRSDVITFLKENQPREFSAHREVYLRLLFDAIRMAYPYQQDAAEKVFSAQIPRDFVPSPGAVNTRSYIFLFRLFGFRTAERIRKIFRRSA
ncbi:MAG TPA: glycosyltransferase family A protein [Bacteroidia bacterium]|nr:glycosyltransferase family A protein [Bacteroidia bacterium]